MTGTGPAARLPGPWQAGRPLLRRLRHNLRPWLGRLALRLRLLALRLVPDRRLPLALVVPVWNDAAGLARLMARLAPLRLFTEVVVVDDGSDPPLAPPRLPGARVRLIRHATPQGGGPARNAGLAAVTQPWMMYIDSDDLPAPDLPALIADLADEVAAGRGFDLCLFKHADSRLGPEARWGQPHWDEALWHRAGHATGALVPARPGALPILAQTANYPWNKVYRTALLRDNGIGCAATVVHQDIALHWRALIAAQRVLVSDRIGVWHGVDVGTALHPAPLLAGLPARLTSRRGEERLQVFAALDPVVPEVAAAGPAWQAAYAAFVLDLIDWTEERIGMAPALRLRRAEAIWLAATLAPWLPLLARLDAALAARIETRIGSGPAEPGTAHASAPAAPATAPREAFPASSKPENEPGPAPWPEPAIGAAEQKKAPVDGRGRTRGKAS